MLGSYPPKQRTRARSCGMLSCPGDAIMTGRIIDPEKLKKALEFLETIPPPTSNLFIHCVDCGFSMDYNMVHDKDECLLIQVIHS